MTTDQEVFTSRQLRDALGSFMTGVTIVTTRDLHGVGHGVTANSFSSVSLDPPLILWSQAYTSKSFQAFQDCSHFAVHILAGDQIALSSHFAKSRDDKFEGIPHESGLGGVPLLDGAVALLECSKFATYPAGDHVIYIGKVERLSHSPRRTLGFAAGKYSVSRSLDLHALHEGVVKSPVSAEMVKLAAAAMPNLAERLGGHTLCLAAWGNHGPTIIAWEASSMPVSRSLATGLVLPITQSAIGLVFAAFLPPEHTGPFIDDDLQHLPAQGADLATRKVMLEQQLAELRNAGHARSAAPAIFGIDAPATVLAVPIRDPAGEGVLVLAVVSSSTHLEERAEGQVVSALLAAVEALSAGVRPA